MTQFGDDLINAMTEVKKDMDLRNTVKEILKRIDENHAAGECDQNDINWLQGDAR